MHFDFCIGNPPYQDDTLGNNESFAPPVYDKFMHASYTIADKVELIHPARFLFNAGATPKLWNKKMLQDEHFKVLHCDVKSSNIFKNVDITGGIAITYHDNFKVFGKIGVYSQFPELNSIRIKVTASSFQSFSSIMFSSESFKFTNQLHIDYPSVVNILSKGHKFDLKSNVLDNLYGIVFFDEIPHDGYSYVGVYGLCNGKRGLRYIRRDYIFNQNNLESYKVFLPNANGSGAIGEVDSTPLIGEPFVCGPMFGSTQTFLSIGSFQSELEAKSCFKYIKSKFARACLALLKITQSNSPANWKYVPLQDFTSDSDIDWSKSIHEIDLQLYKKYGLDVNEIQFIEQHIKSID